VRIPAALILFAAFAAGCGPAAAGGGGSSAPGTSGAGAPPVTGTPPSSPITNPLPPASDLPGGLRATPVVPRPGPRGTAVSPVRLRTGVEGGSPFVDVYWWSGVEPCYTLRPVLVTREGTTIRLRLFEGPEGAGQACIELAMFKTTRVELRHLDPGSYTVVAGKKRGQLLVG
jgi:hypothetical protein